MGLVVQNYRIKHIFFEELVNIESKNSMLDKSASQLQHCNCMGCILILN